MNSDVLAIYLLLPGIIVHICQEATNFPTFSTLSGSFAFKNPYTLLAASLFHDKLRFFFFLLFM